MESEMKIAFMEDLAKGAVAGDLPGVDRSDALEARLIAAVKRRELTVHFQPQYEVATGRGCGVEALARWTLPEGDQISPTEFIPMAERIGEICTLGAWVLEHACQTIAAWGDSTGKAPTLSVNVSTLQINEKFGRLIERIIKRTGLPPEQLELEITESALMADAELVIECCSDWRALGVHIAVDDFGTGYSSLNYLARLPVDRLKLDKSFAQRMTFERKTAAIVRSMLALGREMDFMVLAEGVETESQFALLERWGCQQIQGFLLARPVPAADARALLTMPWGTRLAPISRAPRVTARGLHAA